MKNISAIRATFAIPPLPLYFTGLTAFIACITLLLRHTIVHDRTFTIMNGLIAGIVFATFMASTVAISRWRLSRAIGRTLSAKEQLALSWAVENQVLPQDTQLRTVFIPYIRYYTTLNRHSRLYIPTILGVLAGGCVYLYSITNNSFWILYAGLFAVFIGIGLRGVNRSLRSLTVLRQRLQTRTTVPVQTPPQQNYPQQPLVIRGI